MTSGLSSTIKTVGLSASETSSVERFNVDGIAGIDLATAIDLSFPHSISLANGASFRIGSNMEKVVPFPALLFT